MLTARLAFLTHYHNAENTRAVQSDGWRGGHTNR